MGLHDFTLADVYRRNAALFPAQPAFAFDGAAVSHGDYLARIERLAAGLQHSGVQRGDRVAILSQNCPEMVDLIGAVALVGAILLPVNYRLNADEIGFVLGDGAPKLLIVSEEYRALVQDLLPGLGSVEKSYVIGDASGPFTGFCRSPLGRAIQAVDVAAGRRLRHHSHRPGRR
ncbi:AMP-binding protein, partial [Rhodopseudomonas sp. B29]|uniref:AMP-binding protein n=1 Tax=Rhodopseudomonas sp. B29 TaxID=95607 RepID=UPI0003B5255A